MTQQTRTPITLENLAALGGVIEDKVNARFGNELMFRAGDAWYIRSVDFKTIEDFAAWLKRNGPAIGFKGANS